MFGTLIRHWLRLAQSTCVIALGAVFCPMAFAADNLPTNLTARYDVLHGSMRVGVIEKTMVREGDIYRVSSHIEPDPLVNLIAGGRGNDEAVFMIQGDDLKSVFYSESRSGKPSRSVDFDWTNSTLTFKSDTGDYSRVALPAIDTIDLSSLPFYLMLKPLNTLAGTTIGIVNSKRLGRYRIVEPVKEVIETEEGTLATWRIEKQRVDDTSRSIKFWVDPARGNLPVRIKQVWGERVVTLNLINDN